MLIHRSKLATPTREQQVWAGMRSMNFDIRGYVIFNNFKSSRDNPVGVRVPPPVPSFPFVHGSGPLFLNSHPKTYPLFVALIPNLALPSFYFKLDQLLAVNTSPEAHTSAAITYIQE